MILLSPALSQRTNSLALSSLNCPERCQDTLVPLCKSQKSKELYFRLLRHLEWSVYFCRAVLDIFCSKVVKQEVLDLIDEPETWLSVAKIEITTQAKT